MSIFSDICDDVMTITKRPDLIAETKLAVKAATLKMHQSDFYFKDIYETGISFDASAYKQQLDVRSILPRYRAMKYIRRYDNSGTGEAKEFFKILTPAETVDSYGIDKVGVAYAAGSVFNINSKYPFQYAIIGVYVNPDITETSYNSWVAIDHPFAIVFEAARVVFKQIGFDEQAAAYDRLSNEQMQELRLSNVQAEGY